MFHPSSKAKAPSYPIYPRPVSPLHYEPLKPEPDDLLWEQDSTDGTDEDEDARAAKRRRIERLGEHYLRGHGLFIMSAGIRGPLGKQWKNPWKRSRVRKEEKRKQHRPLEQRDADLMNSAGKERAVPETVERSGRAQEKGNLLTRGDWKPKVLGRRDDAGAKVEQAKSQQNQLSTWEMLSDPADLAAARRLKDSWKESEAQDRRGWLKKDHVAAAPCCDIYAGDAQELERSPSARNKPSSSAKRRRLLERESLEPSSSPPSTAGSSFDGRAETIIKRLNRAKASAGHRDNPHPKGVVKTAGGTGPETASREVQPSAGATSIQSSNLVSPSEHRSRAPNGPCSPPQCFAQQNLPSSPAGAAPDRHGVSSAGNPSEPVHQDIILHPPARLQNSRASTDELSHEQRSMNGPPEGSDPPHPMPAPTLSTEATIVSLVPSAQVVPPAQASTRDESMPSTGDRLSERQAQQLHQSSKNSSYLSTQAAIAAASLQLHHDLTTSRPQRLIEDDTTDAKARTKSNGGITPFSAFDQARHAATSIPNGGFPATRELLEAVAPLDPTTAVENTTLSSDRRPRSASSATPPVSKKMTDKKSQEQRPHDRRLPGATTSAVVSSNNGSCSSQGSIKASLKVSKQQLHSEKEKVDRPRFVGFKEPTMDANGHEDTNDVSDLRSRQSSDPDSHHHSSHNQWHYNTQHEHRVDNINSQRPDPDPSTCLSSYSNLQDGQQDPGILPAAFDTHTSSNIPTTATASNARTIKPIKNKQDSKKQDSRKQRSGGSSKPSFHRQPSPARNHDMPGDAEDGIGVGEADGDFDLSDAMDTVGSFLQTWDVEREYRGKRKTV